MKTHSTKIRRPLAKGFTLLEILAATVVATILLTVSLQVLGSSSETVKAADKKRNAQTQLRTALDRFAADFSTAMLTGGTTAIWRQRNDGSQISSQISFISLSRPGVPSSSDNPRAAAIGYAMSTKDMRVPGVNDTYSELMRGDAPVFFTSDLSIVFADIGKDYDDPQATLFRDRWEPLGTGIVRFHISFLLDDGTITQTPPEYTMTSPQTGNDASFQNDLELNGGIAIAFSERNTPRTATNARYVKALIVAAAAIDQDVLKQSLKAGKLDQINQLEEPGANETPLEVWEKNLKNIDFPPLLQNIRFQQRTIPVS